MIKAIGLLTSVAATGLAACASSARPGAPMSAALQTDGSGVVLGTLPSAALPSKQCGMVVWTLEGDKVSPVLRYVAGGAAQIVANAKTVELARTDASGASAFGVSERQSFTSGDGLTVEVALRFGSTFDGGSWLQNGVITVSTADGWKTVAPAAGVAGCRG